MMAAPLLPAMSGISPLLVNREAVNAALDAARAYRSGRRGFLGQEAIEQLLRSATTSRIQFVGDPTESLDAFSVLAYGPAQIDVGGDEDRPDSQRAQVFTGATPSDASAPFVITAEPAQGGDVIRCVIAGLAVVQVNITSASHARAKPISGDMSKLVSCARGGVPIVSRESGTGVKWSVVLLDFDSSLDCCPDSPTPPTVPLVCPGSGSGSGSATDVGPTCSITHYEPACCSFLATSKCPPDNPPNYTLTSLCSGTTLTATQLQCIITNSSCTVSSIAWKSCEISNGPGPCSEVKSKSAYCVTLANGTGAYAGVSAAVAANLTTAGFAFSYSNTGGAFTISGSLVWCCKSSISGLYFRGKISSQLGTSSDYPCGCVVDITDACSAGSIETITAGPVLSGGVLSTQTLHIKTSCGEIDLQISPAPCPSPPPPPPPGDCNACSLLGNVPTIVIPNGPNAGTYTGTAWATTSAYGTGTPTVQTTVTLPGGGAFPAGDYVFFCYQDSPANAYQGTIWIVQPGGGSGGSFSGAQSITCGTPSIFTNIPGGQVGSSSPLTITT